MDNIFNVLNQTFKVFEIKKEDALIICSGSLYALGIINTKPGDVDIVIDRNTSSWNHISTKFGIVKLDEEGDKINIPKHLQIQDGIQVEIFNSISQNFSVKYCFNNSVSIHGFNFMNPEDILQFYMKRQKEKDIPRIKMIEEFLKHTNH